MEMSRRTFTLGAAAVGAAAAMASPAQAARKAGKSATTRPLDAIVLGAGVSGLNAAWLLEQQGLKVLVLEGRQRVGGRVHTLFDLPGVPEMGFNSMGDGYGRGIDAAHRAGVELIEVGKRYMHGKPQELVLDGKPLTHEQWAAAPFNPLPDALKTSMPWEVTNKLIAMHNPLEDWAAWLDPANASLDISLHAFLTQQGLSDAAIRLVNDVSPYYGINAYDVSALMLEFNSGFVMTQISAGPNSWAIKGGNERLPQGMAALLKGEVLLGKEVVSIDSRTDVAEVRCADGSVYQAGRVVCSLPFSTLRHVAITPGLSGAQARAVATLPYQPLSMAFLTATEPFWEHDGRAPGMWTNSALGTVLPQRFGATADEVTGLLVQARGGLARLWDRLGTEAALAKIVATFEELRPAARGKLKAHRLFSWEAEYFNAGDWAYFAPGQIASFVPTMAEPHGRIHFCGEHTATGARGLEGALESSERAALEILSL